MLVFQSMTLHWKRLLTDKSTWQICHLSRDLSRRTDKSITLERVGGRQDNRFLHELFRVPSQLEAKAKPGWVTDTTGYCYNTLDPEKGTDY